VNPTYEQVSAGGTGHAESVRVTYDPTKVSYAQLLDYFWHHIDPTVKDRQFCDTGNQYRSAIFYGNEAEHVAAEASKAALLKSGKLKQTLHRNRAGRALLSGRAIPPGLLQEESGALCLLSHQLRTRCARGRSLGQQALKRPTAAPQHFFSRAQWLTCCAASSFARAEAVLLPLGYPATAQTERKWNQRQIRREPADARPAS